MGIKPFFKLHWPEAYYHDSCRDEGSHWFPCVQDQPSNELPVNQEGGHQPRLAPPGFCCSDDPVVHSPSGCGLPSSDVSSKSIGLLQGLWLPKGGDLAQWRHS